jgi:hypothetical protein
LGVRDEWENEETALQRSRKQLSTVLGMEFVFAVNWLQLWQALESHFPHGDGFVFNTASIAKAWCDELTARLEEATKEDWADKLIDKLTGVQTVKVELVVRLRLFLNAMEGSAG